MPAFAYNYSTVYDDLIGVDEKVESLKKSWIAAWADEVDKHITNKYLTCPKSLFIVSPDDHPILYVEAEKPKEDIKIYPGMIIPAKQGDILSLTQAGVITPEEAKKYFVANDSFKFE
jgi:hypothetical protein